MSDLESSVFPVTLRSTSFGHTASRVIPWLYRAFAKRLGKPYLLGMSLLFAAIPQALASAGGATGIPALTMSNNAAGGADYSVSLQVLILMTMLSFLPAIVIMMTSF
ncbi:MAG: hypothetical protein ACRC5U_00500, partial [Plesiomonas sp.]